MLKGAQLTVVSTKTKNRIDQWITGQHIFDINDVMKKKLLKGIGIVVGIIVLFYLGLMATR